MNTSMSTVMKNIMTTMSMNITNIATMNIALVGIKKKKITVCADMTTMTISTMSTVPVGMTTMTTTDTIIQAAGANIITALQKRW